MSAKPVFVVADGRRVVRVRCSACDWSATGVGGTTAFGMAWAAHANEAHPADPGEQEGEG